MTNGRLPALTMAQRAEVAAELAKRPAIAAEMHRVRTEILALKRQHAHLMTQWHAAPTIKQLERKYGVVGATLRRAKNGQYKTLNPLDVLHAGDACASAT